MSCLDSQHLIGKQFRSSVGCFCVWQDRIPGVGTQMRAEKESGYRRGAGPTWRPNQHSSPTLATSLGEHGPAEPRRGQGQE